MTKTILDQFVYRFIEAFAFGDGDAPCKIFKGYQNYVTARDRSCIIFTRTGGSGRETGLRLFRTDTATREDGVLTSANLRYSDYQIVSTGIDNEYIGQRLDRLIEAFTSAIGANWWRKTTADRFGGAAPISVGQVMDQTTEGDAGAWELTYTCSFTIAARMELEAAQDWAERIDPEIVQVVK